MVALPPDVKQTLNAIYPLVRQMAAEQLAFDSRWLYFIGAFLEIAVLTAISCSRAASRLSSTFEAKLRRRWLATLAVALALASAVALTLLPLAWYGGFTLMHAFGLSHQTPGMWLRDWAVGTILNAGLFALLALLFTAAVNAWPRHWPLVAAIAAGPLVAFGNAVYPVYVAPLFNEFRPLPRSTLSESILRFAAAQGISASVVYEYDMSRQTTADNAYVAGIGKTERIAVGDNLLRHLPADETLYVVAHEVGHYRLGHLWWGTLYAWLDAVGGLGVVALAGAILKSRGAPAGYIGQPAALPPLAVLLLIYSLLSMPVVNAVSRRMETEADTFAAQHTKLGDAGVRAFARLGNDDLTPLHPPRWVVWYFYTHPPLEARLLAAVGKAPAP